MYVCMYDRYDSLLRVDSFQKLSTTIFIVDRPLLSMITPTKITLLSKSQNEKKKHFRIAFVAIIVSNKLKK